MTCRRTSRRSPDSLAPPLLWRPRRGGTLLEVLISLVIVSLIATSLLEVTRNARLMKTQVAREQQGTSAALRWRVARAAGEAWAQGDQGAFEADALTWKIAMVDAVSADATTAPDEAWRELEVADAVGPLTRQPFRLATPMTQPSTQPTTLPTKDDNPGGMSEP